ncbi:hypothetical protein [Candidatus Nitrospira bockiana]
MRCQRCRGAMLQTCDVVLDEAERLTMRAWRCHRCGEVAEELSSHPLRGERRRMVYAVRASAAAARG